MLSELHVRDLGVIEDLTLELGAGMTALTGETGAGKTLVVEALGLLFGGRASTGLVRAGANEALVEALFVGEAGDGPHDGHELLLARSVRVEGRSKGWIDGRTVPLSALGEAGVGLLDIHGQHEQQSLLSPLAQRRALDSFAGADLGPVREARAELAAIDARLAEFGGDPGERARELDVLGFQVTEIDGAHVDDPHEEEFLRQEEDRLADLGAHRQAAAEALQALEGAGGTLDVGALDQLGRAIAALNSRAPFSSWHGRLQAANAELVDVASDLRHVVETWEDDPAALSEVQARRRQLAELRRKYGATLTKVVDFGDRARARLAELHDAAGTIEQLSAARRAAEIRLGEAEETLGATRRAAAPALARAAGERLVTLAMPGARFDIEVDPTGAGDRVAFQLGANPGEPVHPLAQIASGGELARAMLALRLVTLGGPATLVFDEVDAGVGGAAALALGQALKEVATHHQVLVVTHLAQVAAFADRQVGVHKVARDGRTITEAATLDRDERITELSRMLSGHPDSATARAHASELLASAQHKETSTTNRRAIV